VQFFDSAFQAANPRAQFYRLVVEQKRAFGGLNLRGIRARLLRALTATTLIRRSGPSAWGVPARRQGTMARS
jgi:hypothetical protein